MLQFWLFADHGIYSSVPHTLATARSIRAHVGGLIDGEFIIYVG